MARVVPGGAMATSSTPPKAMPRLLKATYLADQEFLLEETRATKLYYFPGPVLFTFIMGLLVLTFRLDFANVDANLGSVVGGHTIRYWIVALFAVLFLIGLLWILIRYLRWISTVYAVTTRRVILQRGILGKDFDEIPVQQVRGVDVHQSFGQRILGYGVVRVSSEGGSRVGNEDWRGIPKPFKFQKVIENATIGTSPPAAAPAAPWTGPPPSR
jgi:membrane protein YdbS with pleckstrin-like domain